LTVLMSPAEGKIGVEKYASRPVSVLSQIRSL
jgi:hypothetical protein